MFRAAIFIGTETIGRQPLSMHPRQNVGRTRPFRSRGSPTHNHCRNGTRHPTQDRIGTGSDRVARDAQRRRICRTVRIQIVKFQSTVSPPSGKINQPSQSGIIGVLICGARIEPNKTDDRLRLIPLSPQPIAVHPTPVKGGSPFRPCRVRLYLR